VSARKDIDEGLLFVEDIFRHVINAYSCMKGGTDDVGTHMEAARHCMEALENLSCMVDNIKAARAKLAADDGKSVRLVQS
jgi:hypothetical protein